MSVIRQTALVVASALGTGLLAAWAVIPFFTTEAAYLFFAGGSAAGLVFAGVCLARSTRQPK